MVQILLEWLEVVPGGGPPNQPFEIGFHLGEIPSQCVAQTTSSGLRLAHSLQKARFVTGIRYGQSGHALSLLLRFGRSGVLLSLISLPGASIPLGARWNSLKKSWGLLPSDQDRGFLRVDQEFLNQTEQTQIRL
ncbi:hypothetical protein SAMN00790413_04325 [Deinococcus hopiensis KR-140]|uniref:Uncharacterized protein n=1 Tax=Deinococcus hopiensis KR-140 TaxID=695939 RepID=A0A1W1URB1_9DEIO|nr:hypothetical protein SAMN00790413_04325 [Deinococcus hopiensis KR-140]